MKSAMPCVLMINSGSSSIRFAAYEASETPIFASVKAAGHRIVHGMKHSEPERVTPKLLSELHRLTPGDPSHLPREVGPIKAILRRHPKLPQVACFDTAFHRPLPRVGRQVCCRSRALCGKMRGGLWLPRSALCLI